MRLLACSFFALVAVLSLGACIEANVADGVLLCSQDPNRLCPHHYYCASNNYCYRDGHTPSPPPPVDMSLPADLLPSD